MSLRRIGYALLCIGGFILLIGLLTITLVPGFIETKITEHTRLINGSETYAKWKDPSLPIFIRFYIFNVTNPSEVLRGEMPVLEEVGPLVYQEKRTKAVDKIDIDEDTVTFRQSITYFFRPELSAVSEKEIVTIINIPFLTIAKEGLKRGIQSGIVREALHEYIYKNPGAVNIFIRKQIRELLFQGYYDGLLEELGRFKGEPILPNHTFGLYYQKNGTYGPPFVINAGVQDFHQFGKILSVNGDTNMTHWGSDYCNQINGSDGSIFPPFVTKDRVLEIFSDDSCRSIYMTYQKEVRVHGVPAYRFHLPSEIWDSNVTNPENQCFCLSSKKCRMSGFMDLSSCKKGAPIFASAPHFLYGDETEVSKVQMRPSIELHESYLDIEPNTGLLLGAMKRFQINIALEPTTKIIGLKRVPEVMFPILWGEEYFKQPRENAEFIHANLLEPLIVLEFTQWSSLILGFVFLVIGTAMLLDVVHRERKFNESEKN